MRIADEIHVVLVSAFQPTRLHVTDESEKHRGHAGHREGGESHFHVDIAAPAFAAMSRVERHRAVHTALGPIVARIHALGLTISG
jgi:BolA family transcriptional regulator, general stress-responsive regulator